LLFAAVFPRFRILANENPRASAAVFAFALFSVLPQKRQTQAAVKAPLLILSVCLSAAVLALLASLTVHKFYMLNRAASHVHSWQRMDLEIVTQEISNYEIQYPGSLRGSQMTNLNASSLYLLLTSTNADHLYRVLNRRENWDSRGMLVDRWGRPLNIRVRLLTRDQKEGEASIRAAFTLWSNGPNGRDEGGSKDDISTSFDIQISE